MRSYTNSDEKITDLETLENNLIFEMMEYDISGNTLSASEMQISDCIEDGYCVYADGEEIVALGEKRL